jgi:hypothetical protein
MKFKDYVGILSKQLKENPEWAELDVVYASDDEGNDYHKVYHSASAGTLFEGEMDFSGDDPLNAVCIN